MFDDSVYRPRHNVTRANVHREQYALHVFVLEPAFPTAAVKHAGNAEKAEHDKYLGNESKFHEDMPQILLLLRDIRIDEESHTEAVEYFHDERKRSKGG